MCELRKRRSPASVSARSKLVSITTGGVAPAIAASSSGAEIKVTKAVLMRGGSRRRWRQGGRAQPSAHRLLVPLVKLLHAVFHGALVGAEVVLAAFEEGAPAGVHAQRDLVVLGAGLPVRGLLGLDELTLERLDVVRVVELDDVEGLLRALRDQRRDDQHVRV